MQERKLKCKICNYEAKQLHQHLKSEHNLTALKYRELYGKDEIMQIGFVPNNKPIDPYLSNRGKHSYQKLYQRLINLDIYTRDELRKILLDNNLWHKYLGKSKYRTMIVDNPKLYKSVMHYTSNILDTTLENRMKYIVEFNFDISKCQCKCGHKLTYGKLYCRKCPEFKRIKILEKLSLCHKGGVWYNKKSIPIIESVAKEYNIPDVIHAENGGEYRICGYSVDGYSPSKNIVIEYDEKHHFKGNKLSEKDLIRQSNIKKELGCKFIRINYNNEIYYAD